MLIARGHARPLGSRRSPEVLSTIPSQRIGLAGLVADISQRIGLPVPKPEMGPAALGPPRLVSPAMEEWSTRRPRSLVVPGGGDEQCVCCLTFPPSQTSEQLRRPGSVVAGCISAHDVHETGFPRARRDHFTTTCPACF